MGIVETRLGKQYNKEWFEQHPTHFLVISKPLKNLVGIVNWVKENTQGHSTAEFAPKMLGDIYIVRLKWFFELEEDAIYFRLTWG